MAVRYVEYIENVGESYFNTNFLANQDTRLVIDGQLLESYANNNFAGGRNTTSSKVFTIGTVNSNWRVGYNATSKNTGVAADLNRHVFDADKNVFKVDGETIYTAEYATFECVNPIYLFATKGNSDTPYAGQLRLFSCQEYDNGTLVNDYRPCLDDNDVACFYNEVSKKYEYGVGTFIAGPELAVPAVDFGTVCRMPLRIGGVEKIDYADNFADNDWATIANVCAAGLMPDSWKDDGTSYKDMLINGTNYRVDIIGKGADKFSDGSGFAPFTFQLHDSYGTTYAMNSTATNVGGWTSCAMRTTHLPSIRALMPSEVQAALKPVNKLTSEGNTSSTIATTEDDLFFLSEVEVFGSTTYSKSGEGKQYAYYAAGNSKIKKVNGTAKVWNTRSPYASSNNRFCGVGSSGSPDYNGSNNALGAAFAFCFGNKVSGGSGGGGSSETVAVSMTGDYWLDELCYVEYNGEIKTADQVFEVPAGAEITIYCYCATYSGSGASWIKLNGVEVARAGSGSDPFMTSYTHTVTSNVTIKSGTGLYVPDGLNGYRYYTAEITTE